MFKSLRIQNFKAWEDTGQIRMAPITLFFGTNSSGKSSIGQFLMMLRQTVESPDRKAVFYPGSRQSAVQLGSYQEMVYRRNSQKKITFSYEWRRNERFEVTDPISSRSFSGHDIAFEATVGLVNSGQKTLSVNKLSYHIGDDDVSGFSISMERKSTAKSEYKVEAKGYNLRRKPGRVWYPGAPVRFYGFPDEVVAYHQNADFVQTLNFEHERLFRSLHYLGPLRTQAERLYSWTGVEPENVGYAGENTVAAILAARHRKISLGHGKKRKPFEQLIAEKLKEMELIERFRVSEISASRQEYEVKVCAKGSNDWVDLPDVGFGICQVLPVLVQCFYAEPGSIIIMEQPEIHLHPKAQALLADVMIDVMNSRENGADRNIQLIIESHSEHFLRRLQRRIAEQEKDKPVKRDQVAAYVTYIDTLPAKMMPLDMDMFGNIRNWPENFFGNEMEDIAAQSRAAMKRQMAERNEKGALDG